MRRCRPERPGDLHHRRRFRALRKGFTDRALRCRLGTWRVGAFLIDSILLGVLGQVLGWTLSSVWFGLGPYGRLVGLAIGLAYFGIMGSRLAGGATLGKRLLGIAVRDREGHPITIGRALLRAAILLIPFTLNGWALPVMSRPVAGAVSSVLLFGVGAALLLTMIFNRRTRQGLHDAIADTYVLAVRAPGIAALPLERKLPWLLTGVAFGFACLLMLGGYAIGKRFAPQVGGVTPLHQKLQADPRFFSVGVVDQTVQTNDRGTTRILLVNLWHKGKASDATQVAVMNDVTRAALASVPNVDRFDLIRIEVLSAYDLGIATGHIGARDSQKVAVWRERVGAVAR